MIGGAAWVGRAVLVAGLVAFAIWIAGRPSARSPEDGVVAWFDAMARGDLGTAIRLTGGELRRSLESELREGSAVRPRSAGRGLEGVRGVAVRRVESDGENTSEVEVELVFEDRNERQRARLERRGRGWVIVEFSAADHVTPPVRYGTPAFD